MLRRVALALAVLFVLGRLPAAQTSSTPQTPQDQARPTFRTEANFVRVDVYPLLKGKPVVDLNVADFEVFEDGKPQKIETFEFVQVQGSIPQEQRREPNTIQQSRDAIRDPRARVFVLYLDIHHVRIHGSWNVREPLVRLIDRILGPDDLVGVMTPYMAASDIVFARKSEVIAGGLRDRWPWGERFTLAEDKREIEYAACYPWGTADVESMLKEMKLRRRERMTLDSLQELVTWLRYQREERKAILTISEGWARYRPNPDLNRLRVIDPVTGAKEPIPGPDPIGVGPDGRLRMGMVGSTQDLSKASCDADRVSLSQMDNDSFFRDIIQDANRANASFYTVDPRGLAAFDAPIGPDKPPTLTTDLDNLRNRLQSLQELAENTDGLAVINSNDLDKGMRRIADDLSSYYLLGYYTNNAQLDGRYHSIKVNVKRPGVDVRARRGYRAATRREVEAARTAASAPVPESVAVARNALDSLARIRPAAPLRTRVVVTPSDQPTAWVSVELAKPAPAAGTADIVVVASSGTVTGSAPLAAGARSVITSIPLRAATKEPIDVRVRVAVGGEPALSDNVIVDPGEGLPHPVLFRRGPSTGNRLEPVGDPLFSRSDRIRLEIAAEAGMTLSDGRVLDRNGTALELPVTISERTDAGGQRWLSADVTLAALGAGDYLVELSTGAGAVTRKVLTAIRVTR